MLRGLLQSVITRSPPRPFSRGTCGPPIEMELSDVTACLHRLAPTYLAGSWDNVGLLVEPSHPLQVRKLLLTNDLTEPVLQEALHCHINMVLAYHPPIFSALKRLTQSTWKERIIVKCLENRIAVYSPHTSLDAVKSGVNDWLIEPFGGDILPIEKVMAPKLPTPGKYKVDMSLPISQSDNLMTQLHAMNEVSIMSRSWSDDVSEEGPVLCVSLNCTESGLSQLIDLMSHFESIIRTTQVIELVKHPVPGYGAGRLSQLRQPIQLSQAINIVKSHLGLNHIRLAKAISCEADPDIQSVAVCAGSGSSVLRNIPADLYVTGEMSHHDLLDAIHNGHSVILCEHSNTERGFLTLLRERLVQVLDGRVEVVLSMSDKDPLDVV